MSKNLQILVRLWIESQFMRFAASMFWKKTTIHACKYINRTTKIALFQHVPVLFDFSIC